MGNDMLPVLGTGVAPAFVGPLLLRMGWRRSGGLVLAGWGALLLSAAILSLGFGAWGLAMGSVVTMLAALALLVHAAATSRVSRNGRAGTRALDPGPKLHVGWPRIGRRVLIFLLVVPVACAAAAFLGWAVQRALFRAGWDESDTTALALFLAPLFWAAIASAQMMCTRISSMALVALCCGFSGALLWLTM